MSDLPEDKIKVAILEDNEQAGKALVRILESSSDFLFVSWFRSAEAALKSTSAKQVDILIVDIGLPGMNGLDFILGIRKIKPKIKPVVYTIFENEEKIIQAIRNGAKGYILKDTSPDLFLAELRVINLGGAPLTQRIAEKLTDFIPQTTTPSQTFCDEDGILSFRETEIINQVALGLTYADIAEELSISLHTVRRHIENIYQKLDVHTKSAALKKARREGLIGT